MFDLFFHIFSVLEHNPFLYVWILSVFVWFFLEIAALVVHFYNFRHTYISKASKRDVIGVLFTNKYATTTKLTFLKKFYKYVV